MMVEFGKIGERVEKLLVRPQIALDEADLEPIARQRLESVWHRSIGKLLEGEVEDNLPRLERLLQQAANDPMQFADPQRKTRQADDQILDDGRLPQPSGSRHLPHGDFAATERDGITLGLPPAELLDVVLELLLEPTRGV